MQKNIQQIVNEVFMLFDKYGKEDYIGEPISQIEHACQAAQLAEDEGLDEEVILAAFFHDIGHLCAKEGVFESMDGYGVKRHEQIGADFLRSKGFSEKIARLVENHVQAKRYLTFKYPAYYEALSEASKKTLEFQGGKMAAIEATQFENDAFFSLSIQMRTWDEKAKEIGVALPDLKKYKQMAVHHLSKSSAP
jgi:phosphonate degradation associated HDIG domain protein